MPASNRAASTRFLPVPCRVGGAQNPGMDGKSKGRCLGEGRSNPPHSTVPPLLGPKAAKALYRVRETKKICSGFFGIGDVYCGRLLDEFPVLRVEYEDKHGERQELRMLVLQ